MFLILSTSISFAQDLIQTSKQFQDQLNKEYADQEKSPLEKSDLAIFTSLDFFPINEKFILEATFVKTQDAKIFKMKTSTNRLPKYKKYAEIIFKINAVEYKLNVYQNIDLIKKAGFEEYLFLPFSDLTCGIESYIGGRYIDLKKPKANHITIDFNKAYNPYCAYNHNFSCPIVPLENTLNTAIIAGVKKFHD